MIQVAFHDKASRKPTDLSVGGIEAPVNESENERVFSCLFTLKSTHVIRYNKAMKTRIDIRIDPELKDFLTAYAKANYTTVSRIFVDYAARLKKQHGKNISISNLSNQSTDPNA